MKNRMLIQCELIRCEMCGAEITRMSYAQKYCPECAKQRAREQSHKQVIQQRVSRKKKQKLPKDVPLVSGQAPQLCIDVHNANLLGLSYGQYMGAKIIYEKRLKECP